MNRKNRNALYLALVTFAALCLSFASQPVAKADLMDSGFRITKNQVATVSGKEVSSSSTGKVEIAQNTSKYTDPVQVADIEELGFLVSPSAIATGGTLTFTLQLGVQTAPNTYTWFSHQQLQAVDAAPYATGSALQYQDQYVSYAMAAASRAAKALRFKNWGPATHARMQMSMDASHAGTVTVAYWSLK